MRIWVRLSLIVSATIAIGIASFGALTYTLFVRAQVRQLSDLIDRDVERLQSLVREPVLGTPVLRPGDSTYVAQFVSRDGMVVFPMGGGDPLPVYIEPTIVRSEQAPQIMLTAPWTMASGQRIGTIRVAMDVSTAFRTRRTLATVLALGGLAMAVLVTFTAVALLRRTMRPLARLADQARGLDPAQPRLAEYRGPADEVADLASALNLAVKKIRERQRAERDALAEIAHELAAPLSVVAGQLRALSRDAPGDVRLQAAHVAAQELLHTSQDLLTLARGELEQAVDLAIVDVSRIATEVGHEYAGVEIHSAPDSEVVGDPVRLKQMLRNLVRNAVQASGGPEGVTCSVRSGHDVVRVVVADDGPGIPADQLDHVFDRFYGTRGGAGVGLAVVKRIVDVHDGRVSVASDAGAGARFEVVLPSAGSRIVQTS